MPKREERSEGESGGMYGGVVSYARTFIDVKTSRETLRVIDQ